MIRGTDKDGISEVEDSEISEEPSVESRTVSIRRDGSVTVRIMFRLISRYYFRSARNSCVIFRLILVVQNSHLEFFFL